MAASFTAPPGAPRVAVQVDRAELEDLQRAARILLAHPLVTETWPTPDALAQVRRWSTTLTNEMSRVFGYRLDVGRTCARLYRRPATLSPHRGARLPAQPRPRPLGRQACTFLCLTLAALESLGDQTTLSALAEEVLRLRSGDDALPVDLAHYQQRKALVDAVRWLEERGVVQVRDGGAERWLADAEEGDALYDIDRDAASRLLVASPSVLRDVERPEDFLAEPRPTNAEAAQTRLRHRIARRLVEGPVVRYVELSPDELAHVRQRRRRICDAVELLTGCAVEARAEGLCLIDTAVEPLSGDRFPGRGTEAHAALLWGTALVALAAEGDEGEADGRWVSGRDAEEAWTSVFTSHRDRFAAAYRDDPDGLRQVAGDLLARFGLVETAPDGSIVVHAALARYRPTVEVRRSDQLSLLDPVSDS